MDKRTSEQLDWQRLQNILALSEAQDNFDQAVIKRNEAKEELERIVGEKIDRLIEKDFSLSELEVLWDEFTIDHRN